MNGNASGNIPFLQSPDQSDIDQFPIWLLMMMRWPIEACAQPMRWPCAALWRLQDSLWWWHSSSFDPMHGDRKSYRMPVQLVRIVMYLIRLPLSWGAPACFGIIHVFSTIRHREAPHSYNQFTLSIYIISLLLLVLTICHSIRSLRRCTYTESKSVLIVCLFQPAKQCTAWHSVAMDLHQILAQNTIMNQLINRIV